MNSNPAARHAPPTPTVRFALSALLAASTLGAHACSRHDSVRLQGRRPHHQPSALQHAERAFDLPAEALDNLDRLLEDTVY